MIIVNYRHGTETRKRCFDIDASGELVAVECIAPRGAGDLVAAATKAVGIEPCGACKKRQEALNNATPGWARRMIGKVIGD